MVLLALQSATVLSPRARVRSAHAWETPLVLLLRTVFLLAHVVMLLAQLDVLPVQDLWRLMLFHVSPAAAVVIPMSKGTVMVRLALQSVTALSPRAQVRSVHA